MKEELGLEPAEEICALAEQIRAGTLLLPLPRVPMAPPSELPVQLTTFIGREHELTLLSEHVSNPEYRLITVTGPGGVGKTRLALQAASALAEQFADGVYWAPLADIHSDIDLALAIVHALHLELAGAQDIFSQLLQALRNDRRDRLLVLDNFEQLLPVGGAALLLEVLRAAPRLTLLVTSRERLNLQAEAVLAQKRSGSRGTHQCDLNSTEVTFVHADLAAGEYDRASCT